MRQLAFITGLLICSLQNYAQDNLYHFTTSDGVRLYLRTAGRGEPCLFLHGGPGNTSFYFEGLPVAKLLEQNLFMIYFDQRGGGRSESAKDGNYSMERMEKDIEEIRNFLKIKSWSVIGHSFAGVIMTPYARDFPDHVRALIYAHCTLDMTSALHSHIDHGTELLADIGVNYRTDTLQPLFKQMMRVHDTLAIYGIEYKIMFRSQRQKNIEDSLIGAAAKDFNQDFQHHVWNMNEYMRSYASYTSQIKCPVLIITGKKDYAVGPDAYKDWHFKKSKLLFYDAAHVSFQEEPQWFASAVLKFLINPG